MVKINMKNSKNNKRTIILAGVLLALLVVAYKVIFMPASTDLTTDAGTSADLDAAGERVAVVLREMENINFDTNMADDPIFESFRSIEIPLISLPVGKSNPFSGTFSSN